MGMNQPKSEAKRVLFLHPDLGIGGAERLIVDAAMGLQRRGYKVRIVTQHHDPTHCFEETRDGSLEVVVYGDWLPRSLFGRGMVLFAIIRSLWAALMVFFLWKKNHYDVVIVDQISAPVPLFSLTNARVLFYCHFPDLLLSKPGSWLKRLYRLGPDSLEQATTGAADKVLVNSKFTEGVFRKTFSSLRNMPLDVLYPAINLAKYDATFPIDSTTRPIFDLPSGVVLLLSINRFERKKNIMLAILGLLHLRDELHVDCDGVKLVIAGGYDTRVTENVEYNEELDAAATASGLTVSYYPDMSGQVVFLRSFNNQQRAALFERCACVLYTPSNEHFGIVPIEAMYSQRPVVACNSGGPLESVLDGKTGYLCDPSAEAWGKALLKVVRGGQAARDAMGERGKAHVIDHFSLDAFAAKLDSAVTGLVRDKKKTGCIFIRTVYAVIALVILAAMTLMG